MYVGNPYTIYIIQRSNLEPSPVLSRLVNFDSASGYYVMSPLLSSISAGDFKAVAQYLEYKECYPPIFDAETEHACLEGLHNHEDGLEVIGQCGVVTVVAQKLEMPELQALAVSKFKGLQPFPASHFLAVTGLLFGSGLVREGPMYEFVIEYLAVSIDGAIPDFWIRQADARRSLMMILASLPGITTSTERPRR